MNTPTPTDADIHVTSELGLTEPTAVDKRVPCVICIDTSTSMTGCEADLDAAIAEIGDTLASIPSIAPVTEIGIVTFGSDATVARPLTQPTPGQVHPTVTIGGATSYGAALDTVDQLLVDRIEGPRPDGLRIVRPAVFLLSDGAPTDQWHDAYQRLISHPWAPNIFTFGFGQADPQVLGQVANVAGFQFDPTVPPAQVIAEFAKKIVGTVVASATGRQLTTADVQPAGATPIDLSTF